MKDKSQIVVAISGSRTLDNSLVFDECHTQLVEYQQKYDKVIILHGGCPKGADSLGKYFDLESEDFEVKVFLAEWDKYGPAAGPIRNKIMAQQADVLIAFWDGKSKGTKNMIDECLKSTTIHKNIIYKFAN